MKKKPEKPFCNVCGIPPSKLPRPLLFHLAQVIWTNPFQIEFVCGDCCRWASDIQEYGTTKVRMFFAPGQPRIVRRPYASYPVN